MAMTMVHQGITLAYEDRGAGKPPFLFVHGWTCNRSICAPQATYFAQRHRVVSVDLRGHGESDKPQGPYPIAAYAADLAYVIEQLDLSQVVAVGYSMGALAVLQLAAVSLDRVAAIVMVDPASLEIAPEQHANGETLIATFEAGDQEARRQFITSRFFTLPTSDRQLVQDVVTMMLATPSDVAARALRGILEFDGPSVAAQCKVPALHILGTPPLNPPHQMSRLLPDVVHGWPVGGGHFCWLEVPDQVNLMIEGFLRHHV